MKYEDNLKRFITYKQTEEFNNKFPKQFTRNNRLDREKVNWLERQIISNMKIVNNIEQEFNTFATFDLSK